MLLIRVLRAIRGWFSVRGRRGLSWMGMFTSEAVTRGIKVRVESEYAPERSQPSQSQWFFLYTITISNEGTETAQLMTRHWVITDGTGHVEEVKGPGVVGKQPVLAPGESLPFQTRLASPPSEGREVVVRFFNRHDAIAGIH